jgi:hypothetical protein
VTKRRNCGTAESSDVLRIPDWNGRRESTLDLNLRLRYDSVLVATVPSTPPCWEGPGERSRRFRMRPKSAQEISIRLVESPEYSGGPSSRRICQRLCGIWRKCSRCLRFTNLVGRPGLDPGTLRVFPDRPGTSISVQICWPDEVQCPPSFTEVLSRLTSWLDSWLDEGSFQGRVDAASKLSHNAA